MHAEHWQLCIVVNTHCYLWPKARVVEANKRIAMTGGREAFHTRVGHCMEEPGDVTQSECH